MSAPSLELLSAVGALGASSLHLVAHVGATSALGLPFDELSFGPLLVQRLDSRLRLSWRNLGGWTLPRTRSSLEGRDVDFARRAIVLRSAVSLLTSLLIGIVVLELGILLHRSQGETWLDDGLILFGAWSLGIGLMALLPQRWSGAPSDGLWLLQIRGSGPKMRRVAASALIGDQIRRGVRPRDWDPEAVEAIQALPDRSADAARAAYLLYLSALDRDDMRLAAEAVDSLLEGYSRLPVRERPAYRHVALVEGAFVAARLRHDAARAEAMLAEFGDCQPGCAARARADAALWLLQGRRQEALERCRSALQLVSQPADREILFELAREASL